MGGDPSDSAVVSACATVGLKPWIPGGTARPSVATGSHANTGTSRDDDPGVAVTWASDTWNGRLQPAPRAADKTRIARGPKHTGLGRGPGGAAVKPFAQ